jgi:transposase-like protein
LSPLRTFLKKQIGGGKRLFVPYYSPERKAALLKMLLPPLSLSMAEVARREGVSDMSLANWRRKASTEGNAVSENTPSAQNWTAESKFAVVLEASGLSEIELGEYCRRKGLYPEQIKAWRQAFINGQKADKAQQKDDREQARKDKKRIQELERELRRKDKALAETAALLVLRKKLNDYWGIDNEDN